MTNAKHTLTRCRIVVFSLLLLIACVTAAAAQERGRITAVRLTPDMKQLMVRFEGEIGKHSAFVMGKPCRLVLDFESTGLAKIPAKIGVNRDPINEIRLGAVESRSRLVVDFGNRPVPPFKIERGADTVTVHLSPNPRPARNARVNPEENIPRRSVSAREPAGRESLAPSKSVSPAISATSQPDSRMVVKTAGIADNLVFVELADRKDRKKVYRLVVDLDQDQMSVRHATVSDENGNLKRFDLAAAGEDAQMSGDAVESTGPPAGPRKQSSTPAQTPEIKPDRFKWGAQSSESAESPEPNVTKRPGLRMKGFTLQERKPGSEG